MEKIVCQSERAYLKMLEIAETNNISAWVNCKTRAYPIWEYIKPKIELGSKVLYHSIGGNHGLCTNGLHSIDLFVFLSDSDRLTDIGSQIDSEPHLTKRKKYDLSGAFHMKGANGSTCIIDYSGSSQSYVLEVVTTDKFRWVLDHATRQAFEGSVQNNWVLTPIHFEGDLSVSAMSKKIIADILTTENSQLPTLQQAFPSHEYLFRVTLPVFNTFLNTNNDYCPIT